MVAALGTVRASQWQHSGGCAVSPSRARGHAASPQAFLLPAPAFVDVLMSVPGPVFLLSAPAITGMLKSAPGRAAHAHAP